MPHQRARRAEGSAPQVAAQRAGDRGDVAGGDLAQVAVSGGPFETSTGTAWTPASGGGGASLAKDSGTGMYVIGYGSSLTKNARSVQVRWETS
ncbi:hypothetical protein ACFYXQ_29750 [Nocardia jiangxiensis]|uniref:Uncharacterized protein n=1 Tax=Nocardia jiangxiensis TaxID=282685 RepID=A0ABW6S8Q6_9NOCA